MQKHLYYRNISQWIIQRSFSVDFNLWFIKYFFSSEFSFFSLVRSQRKFYFTLKENWDEQQAILPSYIPNITSLIVNDHQFIDFFFFQNIRSLKTCMASFNQCNSISPFNLPNLQHLYISNLYNSNHTVQSCKLSFSSSFPNLPNYQIDHTILNNLPSNSSLSLKHKNYKFTKS